MQIEAQAHYAVLPPVIEKVTSCTFSSISTLALFINIIFVIVVQQLRKCRNMVMNYHHNMISGFSCECNPMHRVILPLTVLKSPPDPLNLKLFSYFHGLKSDIYILPTTSTALVI